MPKVGQIKNSRVLAAANSERIRKGAPRSRHIAWLPNPTSVRLNGLSDVPLLFASSLSVFAEVVQVSGLPRRIQQQPAAKLCATVPVTVWGDP